MATMYFKGTSDIASPVDLDGREIVVGDHLSWDHEDSEDLAPWMLEPIFVVEAHPRGGLCGKGLNKPLYLHDFRFKEARVINKL